CSRTPGADPGPNRHRSQAKPGAVMNLLPSLTEDILSAYLKCPYKAHLKLRGTAGEQSEYEHTQARRSESVWLLLAPGRPFSYTEGVLALCFQRDHVQKG